MTLDRVRPLKLEDPTQGGVETDQFPTSLDPHEDHVDCRGVCFQDDASNDEAVGATRTAGGDLQLRDAVAGAATLTELLAGGGGITSYLLDRAGAFVYTGNGAFLTATHYDT